MTNQVKIIQGIKPILYYVFLSPQEAQSQKQVIAKFEAKGWKFLKRSISLTSQKIGLVFQRQSLKWETSNNHSLVHPFQVFHPKTT